MDLNVVARGLDGELPDVVACRRELADVVRVRAMVDAREAAIVVRLEALGACPESEVASVQRTSMGVGKRVRDRATTARAIPRLGEAMGRGEMSGRKVDTVANGLRGLNAQQQDQVAGQAERIVRAAANQSDREFEATIKRLVDQVGDDQTARFERQRRDSRLRWWTDKGSGMVNLYGTFDPESGAGVIASIVSARERLFHGSQLPDTAPADPCERDQHLNAHALAALLDGSAAVTAGSGPDISVLIDATTLEHGPHDRSIVDVSAGGMRVDLPVDTIRRWACGAEVTPIVVTANGQRIMLGRTVRTANRAQRRALRVLYPTCALCDTVFEHCQIHHVHWYRHGGTTDIDNLLPLCVRHHHLAHEGGWHLQLAPDRTLTVTHPDGTTRAHAPPRARAA